MKIGWMIVAGLLTSGMLGAGEGVQQQIAWIKKEYAPYREAFLGSCPAAEGWLIFAEGEAVGFAIVLRKFASYLATVTAYIEDLYLQEPWGERRHYRQVLKDLGECYRDKGASRIEIRMLKKGVLDPEILLEAGFAPVWKWQVWRKEAKGEEQ